ncbi:MAG: hypothetical protein ACLQVI_35395 [Polyangiaceae bacterium]
MIRIVQLARLTPLLALFATVSLACLSCSKMDVGIDEPKPVPFEVQITVTSDPGQPLPGAFIMAGTKIVGKTDANGGAKVRFGGKEGDQVELSVKCPAEYQSPTTPLNIALRHLSAGSRPPQFEAQCSPMLRTVVVGIRADNGANLPVNYLGRTVARTDASGAALFTLKVKPAEQVLVTLSTAEKGSELLRPESPTLTFLSKDKDDFVLLEQIFTTQKVKPTYHAKKKVVGPTPL